MRLSPLPLVLAAVVLAGCSRKPAPEVVPTPASEPQPATPTPAPPPPPPAADPGACTAAIARNTTELGRMVHFDTDKYDLRPADAAVLDGKAALLRDFPRVRLRIVGHADERYTDEYNLVLGTRRAEAARDYLVRAGIDGGRLETASLGETAPLDPGHTEEAWARNRRAEFIILAGRETLSSRTPGCN